MYVEGEGCNKMNPLSTASSYGLIETVLNSKLESKLGRLVLPESMSLLLGPDHGKNKDT
jgi:hypothetical protein